MDPVKTYKGLRKDTIQELVAHIVALEAVTASSRRNDVAKGSAGRLHILHGGEGLTCHYVACNLL